MVRVTGNEAGRMAGSDCAALEPNTKGFELVQLTKGSTEDFTSRAT